MKRTLFLISLVAVILSACQTNPTSPTLVIPTAILATETPRLQPTTTEELPSATLPSPTATRMPSATVSPTPVFPPGGYGPGGFPANVNPLTGLPVVSAQLLNRRPVVVKIENLPREHRPPFGINSADVVYEYYTEAGGTRFAAVFYGQDAEKVGPIRSARFFDFNVVRMYKATFVFGYAYADLFSALQSSEFNNRLIIEGLKWKQVFTRLDPQGANLLLANTAQVGPALIDNKVENSKQNLEGMFFKLQAPTGGKSTGQVYIRYSGGIYNRWDYDSKTGTYLRFSDAADDANRINEKYMQLTDRLTTEPVAVENLVMLQVEHKYIKKAPVEVVDMSLLGEGPAYIARDGQIYEVRWKRAKASDVLSLVSKDGEPFAFKPGQTWFEVLGMGSIVETLTGGAWKFTHWMP